jgi:uncharacterized protein RhaS with RHS repeats
MTTTADYDGYTATADYDALTLTLAATDGSGDSLTTNFTTPAEMDASIARNLH